MKRIQRIQPIRVGATNPSSKEKNDCTVRALANVTGLSYQECHYRMEAAGRVTSNVCGPNVYDSVYADAGCKQAYVVGKTQGALWYHSTYPDRKRIKGMTLRTLLEKLEGKPGKYIALISGHAVAVVDGFLVDTTSNPANKRVIALYRF